jgi:hypothetical protein
VRNYQRFKEDCSKFTKSGRRVAVGTEFGTMASNICGCSVRNLLNALKTDFDVINSGVPKNFG